MSDSDGIAAIDLSLKYDTKRVAILDVETAGLAAAHALAGNDLGGRYLVSLFGVLPLEGTGALVTVTLRALEEIRALDALAMDAEANEGTIKLEVAPGPETHRPGVQKVNVRTRGPSPPAGTTGIETTLGVRNRGGKS